MSRSYNKDDVPNYINDRRTCILNTLRAFKDALCEAGYSTFALKNRKIKSYERTAVRRIKRINGNRLNRDI